MPEPMTDAEVEDLHKRLDAYRRSPRFKALRAKWLARRRADRWEAFLKSLPAFIVAALVLTALFFWPEGASLGCINNECGYFGAPAD